MIINYGSFEAGESEKTMFYVLAKYNKFSNRWLKISSFATENEAIQELEKQRKKSDNPEMYGVFEYISLETIEQLDV